MIHAELITASMRLLGPDEYAAVMAELDAIRRERTLDALKRIGDLAKDKPIESRVATHV